jgi:hypothetical protein
MDRHLRVVLAVRRPVPCCETSRRAGEARHPGIVRAKERWPRLVLERQLARGEGTELEQPLKEVAL